VDRQLGALDSERMVNGVADVLVGDAVLASRRMDLHENLVYYENCPPIACPRPVTGAKAVYKRVRDLCASQRVDDRRDCEAGPVDESPVIVSAVSPQGRGVELTEERWHYIQRHVEMSG
jgi:hypothetical protein